MIALVLAVALGYFAVDKFVLDPARDEALVEETVQKTRSDALVESYGERSIAVLPFANLSNDPEQEYFSDGIAEELLNLLAQVPRLRVISRSSSFAFKGQAINVPAIAQQLNVNHVLEGSVRRQGDRVRITVQLIEARSDTHLWSQTYERQFEDVFAIQDEISAAIVMELGAKLSLATGESAVERAPANTEAYEAYLRGRHLMAQRSPDGIDGAIDEFRKAVELDPDYALGHASLAIAIGLRGDFEGQTQSQTIEYARLHAERAIELDSNLAEAHAALGWVKWTPGTFWEAEERFRRATQINPGYADAHMWLGHFLRHRNDYVGSLALYQKAAQLDPLSVPAKNNLLNALIARARLDEARQLLEQMARLHPDGYVQWQAQLKSIGGNWADNALAILDLMQSRRWPLRGDLQVTLALMGMEREALAGPAALGLNLEALGNIEGDPVAVLPLLGRPGEALTAWEQQPWGIPQEPGPGYVTSGVLIAATGDFARAGPILERVWSLFLGSAGVGPPSRDASFILALMSARREGGDGAGITELRVALRDAVQRYAVAGLVQCDIFEGCVHFDAGISAYLEGDREGGLALVSKSVESGYFIPPNVAYFQLLYDDPAFEAILEKQKAHQARQREKFLAVVCVDNPYADIWEPSSETCAEFHNRRLSMSSE